VLKVCFELLSLALLLGDSPLEFLRLFQGFQQWTAAKATRILKEK